MLQSQTTTQLFFRKGYTVVQGEPQINTRDAHVPWAQRIGTPVYHFHIDCLSIISILIGEAELIEETEKSRERRDLEDMCWYVIEGEGERQKKRVSKHRL